MPRREAAAVTMQILSARSIAAFPLWNWSLLDVSFRLLEVLGSLSTSTLERFVASVFCLMRTCLPQIAETNKNDYRWTELTEGCGAVRTSIKAVQAFEAAARLGSFALAADELAVAPSAVSH
jgi:hypothetical protein